MIRSYNTSIHRRWFAKPPISLLNFKKVKRRINAPEYLSKEVVSLKHELVHSRNLNETRKLLFLIRRLQITVRSSV